MHHLEANKQTWSEWIFILESEKVTQLVIVFNHLSIWQQVVCLSVLNAPFWGEHSMQDNGRYKIKAPLGDLCGSGAPKTHEHTYYYLCKHVILLSNEPFTVSVMKQLALTQAKWTAESSHVYAARWKQMLRNPNTSATDPRRNRGDFESASFSSAHWLH